MDFNCLERSWPDGNEEPQGVSRVQGSWPTAPKYAGSPLAQLFVCCSLQTAGRTAGVALPGEAAGLMPRVLCTPAPPHGDPSSWGPLPLVLQPLWGLTCGLSVRSESLCLCSGVFFEHFLGQTPPGCWEFGNRKK